MIERLSASVLAVLLAQASATGSMTFWNGSVVDLDAGTARSGMLVEIEDGRISSVGIASGSRPKNRMIIDGTGKFLLPGLWDSHVHLTKLGESALPAFLANGVTSVRDMGSDLSEVLRWRREIESGKRPGPRIKTSGQILESRSNVERMKRERTVEPVDRIRRAVGTPQEAREAVERLASAGADFIKVRTVADATTLGAISEGARARGLALTGHAVASPDGLMDARMASVEHLLVFPPLQTSPEERRALFGRLRDAGLAMGTTTVNLENSVMVPYEEALARLQNDPLRRYVGRYLAKDWAEQVTEKKGAEAARLLEILLKSGPGFLRDLREMHAAGVKFLAGSDAAVVFIHPGFSLHGEIESLVRNVGLKPAEALRAATVNPAGFFGLEQELGSVRPGYRADLLLLEGNPLNDIQNTRRIAGVMQGGRWFNRRALDDLLKRSAREARR